jgi:hypothetical protein
MPENINRFICELSLGRGFNYLPDSVIENRYKCHYQGESASQLVYDNGIYRCSLSAHCIRVMPQFGKLRRYYARNLDPFQVMFINKNIKAVKESKIPVPKMILKRNAKGKIMVYIDGNWIDPRMFSQSWWMLHFEKDF